MNPKKKRADSKLGNLPEARQAQIAEMCATQTLAEVRAQLGADGLLVSLDTLSRWYSCWQLQAEFQRKEELVEQFPEQIKEGDPAIPEEKLFEHGQTMFALLAMEEKSAENWKRVQDVRHQRQKLGLEREKFQRETAELFVKWAKDQKAQEILNNGGLSQSEAIEQIKQLMFADVLNEGAQS